MEALYEPPLQPESIDRLVAVLARRQHGTFTHAQAAELGAGRSVIRRRVETGRWERVHTGVYRLAGSQPSWHQQLLAACLAWGPDSVISHFSAAPLWRLIGFMPGPIELCVPRERKRAVRGCVVHRPRLLPAVDVTVIGTIPVTTPARTLVDLAAVVSVETLEEALDDALRRGLVSLSRLRWRAQEIGRMGRPGVTKLRGLIDAGSAGVPQSVFETRLLRVLKRAGLPQPELQYQIRDRGKLAAVVDFAFPKARLAVEAEGYRWHSGRLRFEHDLARRNRLTRLGWRVVHVTWRDLTERSDDLVADIVLALG